MPALRGLVPGLRLGDDGGGLEGGISPAVADLPGADEDARAGRGHAVPINVELGDVAVARFRGRQAAKNGEMLGEGDARAPRVGGEDKDVRGRSAGDAELEIHHAASVGDDEFGRRVGAETGTFGPGEYRLEALVGQSSIDFHEDQVAGETARLTETGPAAGVRVARRPRGALVGGEGAP